MHRIRSCKVIFLLCVAAFQIEANAQPAVKSSPSWDVYFSPRGGATFAVRQALDKAKSSVLVQAYSFTSAPIAEALVRAHRRGVKVQLRQAAPFHPKCFVAIRSQ